MKQTKRKSLILISLIISLSMSSFAASELSDAAGKTYYLKHNITFPEGPPKVFPGLVTFTERKYPCSITMWNLTLPRGTKVKIRKMTRKKMFMETEIDLVNNKECFTIWLSSKDKKDFELSFDEIFSGKKVQGTPLDCKPKTTEQLIDCYGYPIYKCIRNGKENWYYNLGFVGREIDGFHDCWVEVKDGRVLGFWGHL